MAGFRILLAGLWLLLVAYTAAVVSRHGLDLLPIFFGAIADEKWPGQFNLDFLCFLVLSALWTAWRAHFSPTGLALAVVAFFGGAGFLLPYLLLLSWRTRGNIAVILLGPRRATGSLRS